MSDLFALLPTAEHALHDAISDAGDSDDDGLFFTDTVGEALPTYSDDDADGNDSSASAPARPPAAKRAKWHDDDDDETEVDLTSVNRLRKLRKDEDETTVSGAELQRRMADHFSKTAGQTPTWALVPSVKRELVKERLERKRKRKADQAVAALLSEGSSSKKASKFKDVLAPTAALFNDDDPMDEDDDDDEGLLEMLDEDEAAGLMASTASLVHTSRTQLPKESLSVARLPNLQYTHSSVTSVVRFHPTANVLLTAGLDKTVRLSQVNGRDNPVLARVYLEDLPIHNAVIHPSGTHAILTGRRKYAYEYHLETGAITKLPPMAHVSDAVLPSLEQVAQSQSGKYLSYIGANGNVAIVDGHTKKWVANVKMNGTVKAAAWMGDNVLTTIGGDGVVYVWDVGMRKCITKWADDGGFKNAALAVARDGQYLATGAYSGIVNVYQPTQSDLDWQWQQKEAPSRSTLPLESMRHIKAVSNLTTPIYQVGFNHDAQILAMSSRSKKDQFKLVHLPTCQVFANWPTQHTPLSYVESFDFSPHSAMVAIGNDKGRVLLYKLKHYPRY
ncbi:U3 snoRNP protein [Allomyces javanicus]|nr:U3 snoRNP protein [Allomyces javanicus]